MTVFPICKINLGLYIVEKRPDGYHNLETVFYPIPLNDNLEIQLLEHSNEPYILHQTGIQLSGNAEDNLVIRVLNLLRRDFNIPPLEIWLHKRIPSGAGLGGGSSNAAYMMKALNERFQLGLTSEQMENLLMSVGADCPFFVKSIPAYATGIGEQLSPLPLSLKGWYLVLIKPNVFVSTREAFSMIRPQQPAYDLRTALAAPVEAWRNTVTNDFEKSVFAAHPQIAAIKATLYDMGAAYAAMSGSGSSVFGLFKTPRPEFAEAYKDCFVYTTTLT